MSRFRNPMLPVFFLHFILYSIFSRLSSSTVVVTGNNVSLSFQDIAANFAPATKPAGVCGRLYLAEPLDACSSLRNNFERRGNHSSRIALIVRGHCGFEEKVRKAQKAGFDAVIVYDNEAGGSLVAMAGNSAGIKIHAVFVSKAAGEKLTEYAAQDNVEVLLVPSYENSAWSIMAISFISLLAMSAFLATCFFVRRHRIRRERPREQVREFHGMSSRLVKAMPSLVFTTVSDDAGTSSTCCAICLEDYRIGEKIRILPCNHKFHAVCVDCWLTSWRTFCPVCKRDARTSTGIPPASESTPLLSSAASSPQSIRSSLRSYSSFIHIASPSPRSHSSLTHSAFNSPHGLPRPNSTRYPPSSMSMSRSSLDLRNMSARRSASHLISPSPHSSYLRHPSMSPQNSRYISPCMSSSYLGSASASRPPNPLRCSESPYMSSSYLGSASASRPPNPLRYSESAASFSPFSSTHSLPDC